MHLAMYRARSNAQAVVHVHPTYAIAYSTLISGSLPTQCHPIRLRSTCGRDGCRSSIIPLAPIRCMKPWRRWRPDYHAILLRQHGVIVAGADMSVAIGVVEEVEQCCPGAVATGLKGASLTDDQLQAMDDALGRTWK